MKANFTHSSIARPGRGNHAVTLPEMIRVDWGLQGDFGALWCTKITHKPEITREIDPERSRAARRSPGRVPRPITGKLAIVANRIVDRGELCVAR